MQTIIGLALLASSFALTSAEGRTRPPMIRNPVLLNIGFVCRWQARCMDRQQRAMERALRHVRNARPPSWKVQLCNRNASRSRSRVDWIGFYNCIRNRKLRRPRR